MNDDQIIGLYFSRDESAIGATDEKYGSYCMKISHNILASLHDSEENVSDTYLKAWQSIPPTRPRILKAYLGRIARNLALNRANMSHAAKRAAAEFTMSLDEVDECTPSNVSVEDGAAMRELSQKISDFLRGENDTAARMFVCRYFYSESVKEIAERFGSGESRVKSSLMRTRQRLAKHLAKEGYSFEK